MSLSKRLRFEVLRRDHHTCQYCGEKAPDVQLRVDHVIPQALGGSDDPSNLVTACEPCNSGKTSVPSDAPTVAAVSDRALRWRDAVHEAFFRLAHDEGRIVDARLAVEATWTEYGAPRGDGTVDPFPRPDDWPLSVSTWVRLGLDARKLMDLVRESMYRDGIRDRWSYFCGIVWRYLDERQRLALDIVETDPTTWELHQIFAQDPQPAP